jgi:hypothetical protein
MKGVVFNEFMDMVSARFGDKTLDEVIAEARLPTGGPGPRPGSYPHEQITALVASLSSKVGSPQDALVRAFGRHLFKRFSESKPAALQGSPDALTFLQNVDQVIDTELRKSLPHGEPPRVTVRQRPDGGLDVLYLCSRHLADLAEGLIQGCAEHFKQPLDIQRRNQPIADGSAGTAVLFSLSAAQCERPAGIAA